MHQKKSVRKSIPKRAQKEIPRSHPNQGWLAALAEACSSERGMMGFSVKTVCSSAAVQKSAAIPLSLEYQQGGGSHSLPVVSALLTIRSVSRNNSSQRLPFAIIVA